MEDFPGDAKAPTSFLLIENHLIGFMISIFVTCQRNAGFQKIASKIDRAADGVMTS